MWDYFKNYLVKIKQTLSVDSKNSCWNEFLLLGIRKVSIILLEQHITFFLSQVPKVSMRYYLWDLKLS